MTYYSALHYAAKAEKSASTAVEAAEIAKQLGNDRINQTHITNCITEIPQDIKLELVDGALTLKAGSKVYVPNGFEADGVTPKFDVVVIASDLTYSTTGTLTGQTFIVYNAGKLERMTDTSTVFSGSTQPSSTASGAWWYDTNTNTMKGYSTSTSSWNIKPNVSLPIALATMSNGSATSIDQVFNGFGYIGSTLFALPGVKGLIPNGRNADGSLKNIEYVSDKMFVINISAWGTQTDAKLLFGNAFTDGADIQLNFQDYKRFVGQSSYLYRYDEDENLWYFSSDSGGTWKARRVLILSDDVNLTGGVVTSLTPKLPFHAVDYKDLIVKADKSQFQVVSTLPSSPQPDVFYFIPE